jgi:hypothetical protein
LQTSGQTIHIHLDGPGWEWVDQTESKYFVLKFRVRQYVYFRASVDLDVTFDDIWWNEASKVASVRLRTIGEPTTGFWPLSSINARGANPLGSLVGAIAPGYVESKAQSDAESVGQERFRDAIKDGLTITYLASTGQVDMAPGRLPLHTHSTNTRTTLRLR